MKQLAAAGEMPAVLQIEHHPMLQRQGTLQYCREQGVAVQGYGNGGGGWRLWRKKPELYGMLQKPAMQAVSRAQKRSAHQISLRWSLEQVLLV
jgi:diketogulonate reductase-like aldo/keto reductase